MSVMVFDGRAVALERQVRLKQSVAEHHRPITVASLFFTQDKGSVLYTRLKRSAAEAVGMTFQEYACSLTATEVELLTTLARLNHQEQLTGIIVQKPTEAVWQDYYRGPLTCTQWWRCLAQAVAPSKDIDCLNPRSLAALHDGADALLPATVKAILIALGDAFGEPLWPRPVKSPLAGRSVAIVGCSDIIGLPLADVLRHHRATVELMCDRLVPSVTQRADIVVSATGAPQSITADHIKAEAILIDVGSPVGDVDFAACISKAAFITPVPRGIGPLTVVSLLENAQSMAMTQPVTAYRL